MGNIERDRYQIASDHEGIIDYFTDWIDDFYAGVCIAYEKDMGRTIDTNVSVFLYLFGIMERFTTGKRKLTRLIWIS